MTDASERAPPKQDPRTQYPQPPFKRQPQEAPGLAQANGSEARPRETSYKGHGRLAGRKALVTGPIPASGARPPSPSHVRRRRGAQLRRGGDAGRRGGRRAMRAEGRKAVLLPATSPTMRLRDPDKKAVNRPRRPRHPGHNAGKQTNQKDIGDITDEQFDRNAEDQPLCMF